MRRVAIIDWLYVTRPWAFSCSLMSVLVVVAWIFARFRHGDILNAVLAAILIVLLHAATDVLSDCRDHASGVDGPDARNGVSWIRSGLFTVRTLRRYAALLLCVAIAVGMFLLARTSWTYAWIGVAGVLISLGYSFLKYRALGDVAVLFAFVILPALGVGCVVADRMLPVAILVALPPGLLTLAILNANNIRDRRTDDAAHCRTLPIIAGARPLRLVYVLETLLPYALVAIYIALGLAPYAAIATFLTLPLAWDNVARARREAWTDLDRRSARLQLLFGVLAVLAYPIALLNFWTQLSIASVITGTLGILNQRPTHHPPTTNKPTTNYQRTNCQLPIGIAFAALLWGVFWVGDFVSRALFGFARPQVDAIYALREGCSPWLIAALLLFLIGPAEELFWRGLVQHRLSLRLGPNAGFALATLAYTLMHVFSGNVMLIAAAAVCGLCWGAAYRFFPRYLPAIVLSHALWDATVFVLLPIT